MENFYEVLRKTVKENAEISAKEIVEELKEKMLEEANQCKEVISHSFDNKVSMPVIEEVKTILESEGLDVKIIELVITKATAIRISWF